MTVQWRCPECKKFNGNDIEEILNYAQFCDKCGKEFYVDTDGLFVLATDVKAVEE